MFGHTSKLGMLALLVLAVACGNKENKVAVPVNNNNSGQHTTPQYTWPDFTSQQSGVISQLKSSHACQNGAQRLSQDITFHTTTASQNNGTRIEGPFTQGNVTGDVHKLYIGRSVFNDLMIVSKATNGNQVVGFNITISMCSSMLSNGLPYIHDSRPLGQFQAQAIILDEDTYCGFGSIDGAINTVMVSAGVSTTWQGQPVNLQPAPITTTFTKLARCP